MRPVATVKFERSIRSDKPDGALAVHANVPNLHKITPADYQVAGGITAVDIEAVQKWCLPETGSGRPKRAIILGGEACLPALP